MQRPFHADLHCHSTFSDGTLTPAALAQRAQANGVTLWALTDHDEVEGLAEAQSAAYACGLDFLTGVEISVSFADTTVHIVGLGFDADNTALQQGLHALRNNRGPRAQEMGLQLAAAGIPNAYEGALKYVGNPALISRTHFARYLVEAGICKDTYEVFKHFLVEGKPGYAPQRWASLEEAVGWITDAHGVAVIAHPARYNFSHTEEYAFFSSFKSYGGQAIEAVTGSHAAHEFSRYAELAKEFGFAISRGSDFHSPQESKINLGALPPDPAGAPGVGDLLAERIHRADISHT
ncbi:PHP domain-containing protein [Comamonas sp.]|uniref:PHP domain-containing protein n=1 Tax=Comamonas sp. TaxID=34028 RepID=UPI0028996D72|nr:PHP domain-containing protein [Comamonas sp.]